MNPTVARAAAGLATFLAVFGLAAPAGAAPTGASYQLRLVAGYSEDAGAADLVVGPQAAGGWEVRGTLTKATGVPGCLHLEAGDDGDTGRTAETLAVWCGAAGTAGDVSARTARPFVYLVWRGGDGLPAAWSSRRLHQ
ncbi:hypothetical protein [Streptomyces sp. NBC_01006]|uniref:hypothetical protein n=1 Tax=Streptomyces sp. NBC_01006 TaxID=2903716 RepID=UPI002F919CAB|nr:hypothetical protein OG509_42445 [Streptomyces sp. NBC_01006]